MVKYSSTQRDVKLKTPRLGATPSNQLGNAVFTDAALVAKPPWQGNEKMVRENTTGGWLRRAGLQIKD